ncbi:unnamed protein product [Spodoptera exigua]|nr:unnamed protein product [Spodoptera exigua]
MSSTLIFVGLPEDSKSSITNGSPVFDAYCATEVRYLIALDSRLQIFFTINNDKFKQLDFNSPLAVSITRMSGRGTNTASLDAPVWWLVKRGRPAVTHESTRNNDGTPSRKLPPLHALLLVLSVCACVAVIRNLSSNYCILYKSIALSILCQVLIWTLTSVSGCSRSIADTSLLDINSFVITSLDYNELGSANELTDNLMAEAPVRQISKGVGFKSSKQVSYLALEGLTKKSPRSI